MGGGLLPRWETTTSPELDRVSVMAGGNLWHLPLPPSLSSHRKAAGVLPVRAKAVGGVCGHPSPAMQPAPLVPIKTPSHPLPRLSLSSQRKGFKIPTFKIPMFKIPMNQNTNRPYQNTNRPYQNTNGPYQNTNKHYQNTNNAFSNTNGESS